MARSTAGLHRYIQWKTHTDLHHHNPTAAIIICNSTKTILTIYTQLGREDRILTVDVVSGAEMLSPVNEPCIVANTTENSTLSQDLCIYVYNIYIYIYIYIYQGRRNRGVRGGNCPPNHNIGGALPPQYCLGPG